MDAQLKITSRGLINTKIPPIVTRLSCRFEATSVDEENKLEISKHNYTRSDFIWLEGRTETQCRQCQKRISKSDTNSLVNLCSVCAKKHILNNDRYCRVELRDVLKLRYCRVELRDVFKYPYKYPCIKNSLIVDNCSISIKDLKEKTENNNYCKMPRQTNKISRSKVSSLVDKSSNFVRTMPTRQTRLTGKIEVATKSHQSKRKRSSSEVIVEQQLKKIKVKSEKSQDNGAIDHLKAKTKNGKGLEEVVGPVLRETRRNLKTRVTKKFEVATPRLKRRKLNKSIEENRVSRVSPRRKDNLNSSRESNESENEESPKRKGTLRRISDSEKVVQKASDKRITRSKNVIENIKTEAQKTSEHKIKSSNTSKKNCDQKTDVELKVTRSSQEGKKNVIKSAKMLVKKLPSLANTNCSTRSSNKSDENTSENSKQKSSEQLRKSRLKDVKQSQKKSLIKVNSLKKVELTDRISCAVFSPLRLRNKKVINKNVKSSEIVESKETTKPTVTTPSRHTKVEAAKIKKEKKIAELKQNSNAKKQTPVQLRNTLRSQKIRRVLTASVRQTLALKRESVRKNKKGNKKLSVVNTPLNSKIKSKVKSPVKTIEIIDGCSVNNTDIKALETSSPPIKKRRLEMNSDQTVTPEPLRVTDIKEYNCNLCSNEYKSETEWKAHELTHSGCLELKIKRCSPGEKSDDGNESSKVVSRILSDIIISLDTHCESDKHEIFVGGTKVESSCAVTSFNTCKSNDTEEDNIKVSSIEVEDSNINAEIISGINPQDCYIKSKHANVCDDKQEVSLVDKICVDEKQIQDECCENFEKVELIGSMNEAKFSDDIAGKEIYFEGQSLNSQEELHITRSTETEVKNLKTDQVCLDSINIKKEVVNENITLNPENTIKEVIRDKNAVKDHNFAVNNENECGSTINSGSKGVTTVNTCESLKSNFEKSDKQTAHVQKLEKCNVVLEDVEQTNGSEDTCVRGVVATNVNTDNIDILSKDDKVEKTKNTFKEFTSHDLNISEIEKETCKEEKPQVGLSTDSEHIEIKSPSKIEVLGMRDIEKSIDSKTLEKEDYVNFERSDVEKFDEVLETNLGELSHTKSVDRSTERKTSLVEGVDTSIESLSEGCEKEDLKANLCSHVIEEKTVVENKSECISKENNCNAEDNSHKNEVESIQNIEEINSPEKFCDSLVDNNVDCKVFVTNPVKKSETSNFSSSSVSFESEKKINFFNTSFTDDNSYEIKNRSGYSNGESNTELKESKVENNIPSVESNELIFKETVYSVVELSVEKTESGSKISKTNELLKEVVCDECEGVETDLTSCDLNISKIDKGINKAEIVHETGHRNETGNTEIKSSSEIEILVECNFEKSENVKTVEKEDCIKFDEIPEENIGDGDSKSLEKDDCSKFDGILEENIGDNSQSNGSLTVDNNAGRNILIDNEISLSLESLNEHETVSSKDVDNKLLTSKNNQAASENNESISKESLDELSLENPLDKVKETVASIDYGKSLCEENKMEESIIDNSSELVESENVDSTVLHSISTEETEQKEALVENTYETVGLHGSNKINENNIDLQSQCEKFELAHRTFSDYNDIKSNTETKTARSNETVERIAPEEFIQKHSESEVASCHLNIYTIDKENKEEIIHKGDLNNETENIEMKSPSKIKITEECDLEKSKDSKLLEKEDTERFEEDRCDKAVEENICEYSDNSENKSVDCNAERNFSLENDISLTLESSSEDEESVLLKDVDNTLCTTKNDQATTKSNESISTEADGAVDTAVAHSVSSGEREQKEPLVENTVLSKSTSKFLDISVSDLDESVVESSGVKSISKITDTTKTESDKIELPETKEPGNYDSVDELSPEKPLDKVKEAVDCIAEKNFSLENDISLILDLESSSEDKESVLSKNVDNILHAPQCDRATIESNESISKKANETVDELSPEKPFEKVKEATTNINFDKSVNKEDKLEELIKDDTKDHSSELVESENVDTIVAHSISTEETKQKTSLVENTYETTQKSNKISKDLQNQDDKAEIDNIFLDNNIELSKESMSKTSRSNEMVEQIISDECKEFMQELSESEITSCHLNISKTYEDNTKEEIIKIDLKNESENIEPKSPSKIKISEECDLEKYNDSKIIEKEDTERFEEDRCDEILEENICEYSQNNENKSVDCNAEKNVTLENDISLTLESSSEDEENVLAKDVDNTLRTTKNDQATTESNESISEEVDELFEVKPFDKIKEAVTNMAFDKSVNKEDKIEELIKDNTEFHSSELVESENVDTTVLHSISTEETEQKEALVENTYETVGLHGSNKINENNIDLQSQCEKFEVAHRTFSDYNDIKSNTETKTARSNETVERIAPEEFIQKHSESEVASCHLNIYTIDKENKEEIIHKGDLNNETENIEMKSPSKIKITEECDLEKSKDSKLLEKEDTERFEEDRCDKAVEENICEYSDNSENKSVDCNAERNFSLENDISLTLESSSEDEESVLLKDVDNTLCTTKNDQATTKSNESISTEADGAVDTAVAHSVSSGEREQKEPLVENTVLSKSTSKFLDISVSDLDESVVESSGVKSISKITDTTKTESDKIELPETKEPGNYEVIISGEVNNARSSLNNGLSEEENKSNTRTSVSKYINDEGFSTENGMEAKSKSDCSEIEEIDIENEKTILDDSERVVSSPSKFPDSESFKQNKTEFILVGDKGDDNTFSKFEKNLKHMEDTVSSCNILQSDTEGEQKNITLDIENKHDALENCGKKDDFVNEVSFNSTKIRDSNDLKEITGILNSASNVIEKQN